MPVSVGGHGYSRASHRDRQISITVNTWKATTWYRKATGSVVFHNRRALRKSLLTIQRKCTTVTIALHQDVSRMVSRQKRCSICVEVSVDESHNGRECEDSLVDRHDDGVTIF